MAITTTYQPRPFWTYLIMTIVCFGLGAWGAYDYWVRIPQQERDYQEYHQLLTDKEALLKRVGNTTFSPESPEAKEGARIDAGLAKFSKEPILPAAYDPIVQLWFYVIGCGVLGVPFGVWSLYQIVTRKYRLEDDGTLQMPEGTWKSEDIADIDMSRWMRKSIATVVHRDGSRVDLDDYKYKNLHLIVGQIAHRFYPDEWTPEARMVKKAMDKKRLLFLCTGNSIRSILAEAIANQMYGDRLAADSAGSRPKGEIHPLARETLTRHGLSTESLRSKNVDELTGGTYDLLITLCDSAANDCPTFAGAAQRVHWSLPDPMTADDPQAAFEQLYETLTDSLEAIAAAETDLVGAARQASEAIHSRWTTTTS